MRQLKFSDLYEGFDPKIDDEEFMLDFMKSINILRQINIERGFIKDDSHSEWVR